MRDWILRWLGLAPKNTLGTIGASPMLSGTGHLLPELRARNIFEVIPAINGKIVVYNRRIDNPHGPDTNDMEIYLVHEGDKLLDTITAAIVSAGLK
jgi:hypothetical protein